VPLFLDYLPTARCQAAVSLFIAASFPVWRDKLSEKSLTTAEFAFFTRQFSLQSAE